MSSGGGCQWEFVCTLLPWLCCERLSEGELPCRHKCPDSQRKGRWQGARWRGEVLCQRRQRTGHFHHWWRHRCDTRSILQPIYVKWKSNNLQCHVWNINTQIAWSLHITGILSSSVPLLVSFTYVELLLHSHFLCLCHLVVLHCKWKHHWWNFFFSFGLNVRVCSRGREVERLRGTVRASELMGPHMGAVSVWAGQRSLL